MHEFKIGDIVIPLGYPIIEGYHYDSETCCADKLCTIVNVHHRSKDVREIKLVTASSHRPHTHCYSISQLVYVNDGDYELASLIYGE